MYKKKVATKSQGGSGSGISSLRNYWTGTVAERQILAQVVAIFVGAEWIDRWMGLQIPQDDRS